MKDEEMAQQEAFVMTWETLKKTVVIISDGKNQRRDDFTTIYRDEVGIRVWGELKWHEANLHLDFVNKVLYFQAL
jgi:hypothetical protein